MLGGLVGFGGVSTLRGHLALPPRAQGASRVFRGVTRDPFAHITRLHLQGFIVVEGREGKGRAGRARARKGGAFIEHLLELDEDLELAFIELSSLRLDRQVILITQPTWDWENELGKFKGGLLTLPWHPRERCGHVGRALAEVPIENAC